MSDWPVTLRLDRALVERVRAVHAIRQVTMSSLVETAISRAIDELLVADSELARVVEVVIETRRAHAKAKGQPR
jgi:hypothetical protein